MYRWIIVLVLLSAMSMSAYYRRRARREGGTISRSREEPLLVVLRLAATVPLLAAIAAYLISPAWMAWSSLPLPGWLRILAIVVAVSSVALLWWVLRSIGRNISETVLTKESHQLVTTGPYRWVRHPLYSVGLALLFSIGVMAANLVMLAITVVWAVLILSLVIPREETALLEKFGDDYRSFRSRTGRLLPRPFG